ncbi:phage/plasmid primase, P4 family [Micromonospora inyonensis]|uniref:Phage/plasmid primase, P4 family, C-terminal domain-containing protein n=1 Tax=Micromonospora inyonensis TaxID=47866 RepID=A0A1C6SRH5_9ACTN|nr:phage/plasmid primase, P4 family [Micromonospora inyonensis]SCL25435.1 phage/plasmid primase, P4 family, C-terminal domain-containing protein [Micromonospora inyonensis]SCL32224.1 phage/plasmid primase, P4 family, C-terminal domain-containing protein [Micromonospora inyonensis]
MSITQNGRLAVNEAAGEQVDETYDGGTTLDAALAMVDRGCYIFPVDHPELPKCVGVRTPDHDPDACTKRGKHPAVGKWSIESTAKVVDIAAHFAGTLRNYGIDCRASHLLVIDEDTPGAFQRYADEHGHTIPRTFTVATGRAGGGRHLYFRAPRGSKLGTARGALPAGVDVRGVGGYVVGPGSVHQSGAVYAPEDPAAPFAELPGWLADALTVKAAPPLSAVAAEPLAGPLPRRVAELLDADPGDRSERFHRIVRELAEAGLTQGQAVTVLTPWCERHSKYVGRVAAEVARSWGKPGRNTATGAERPATGGAADDLSDARMAETISTGVLGDRFCWTAALGWMEWDGQVWRRSNEAAVVEVVRQYVLDLFSREVQAGAAGERRKMLSGLLGRGRIGAIASLAKGILLQDAASFDQHPDLLNTPSGVVNLRTKQLMPHDPALLLTKMTAVAYRPNAVHPDWTTALQAIPGDVRDWYQVRVGQGITGHMTPDDVLVVNQGGGENGKTTVLGTASKVLGSYYVLVSDRVLLADAGAHPTELMELRGARLALVEETPEARRLSVGRLKKVVGTPEIEARYIRQDSVTFTATHSLFLSTNYRPVVEETDHGTWRRLALVRFPYRFVKREADLTGPDDRLGDPTLRERLMASEQAREAALAWMVEGAHRWYQAGRVMPEQPPRVVEATRAWRAESDLVLAYVDDRLVADRDSHVISTELLADFNEWLTARGHRAWADKMFTSRFGEHDELAKHRVEKRQMRDRTGLSRRPTETFNLNSAAIPARYTAWLGIRFATETDRAADLDESGDGDPVARVARQVPVNRDSYTRESSPDSALPPLPNQRASIEREAGSVPLWPEEPPACPDCGWPYDAAAHYQNCEATR